MKASPSLFVLAGLVLVACASESHDNPPRAAGGGVRSDIPSQAVMVGLYAYMADAASFTRCSTGTRYPVAMEGDHAALERAYLATPHEPGAPVLVTVQGRYESRPAMEGGPREHLIVDRFDGIWPDETCEKSGIDTPIRNTYWKLVELSGKTVRTQPDQREVHILLRTDTAEARGFAGCNSFNGGFVLEGTTLRFTEFAATQAACPYLEEETAFFAALGAVTSYRILGETLLLMSDSTPVARLRAVYF
ncbi:MAG: META domain-containing protein [Candidatus Krumholzibacteria bacterium]|nr:META domain-containing protein [Candidatus Krumholzibacteria bacterium]MDH4336854.1 META domain-containing protein [Candidatus Krumholzibacteria bacterium]MDH5269185.1 META domain-containing protein [Candidatus Krumholzibacteria bacterium]